MLRLSKIVYSEDSSNALGLSLHDKGWKRTLPLILLLGFLSKKIIDSNGIVRYDKSTSQFNINHE